MTEVMQFIQGNLIGWLEPLGIIASLVFSGVALRNDVRTRKFESRIKITQSYREVWRVLLSDPALERIRKTDVDLNLFPVTPAEDRLVRFVLQHMLLTHDALTTGQLGDIGDFDRDVREFISRPIPLAVWHAIAHLQPWGFRKFVESVLQD